LEKGFGLITGSIMRRQSDFVTPEMIPPQSGLINQSKESFNLFGFLASFSSRACEATVNSMTACSAFGKAAGLRASLSSWERNGGT
jgi:hypothetical protein